MHKYGLDHFLEQVGSKPIIIVQGGMNMNNNNVFNGAIAVNQPEGSVAFGSGNAITNNLQNIEQNTEKFITEVKDSTLDRERKNELEQLVRLVVDEVRIEAPNKGKVTAILDTIKTMIQTGSAAATLINFYHQWAEPIHIFFGMPS